MRGKGLVRDLLLIGVTAIAVTGIQAYAQDDPPPTRITITCQTGHLIVSDLWDTPIGTTIVLGTNARGDRTVLEDCVGENYTGK